MALVSGLTGCEFSTKNKPSILVIAVEGLGFEAINCDSETATANALCEESVRFSHAFAPSTMGQATLTSVLTGLYPVDTGVRTNGKNFLSGKFQTVAEGAHAQGYRTAFFSGGPPIWRKSGLAQGFELFDDQVDLSMGLYYRPADDVFRQFERWVDHEAGGQSFLSVCYLADLQFPQVATRTSEGEPRERSALAQLEAVNDSLGALVRWLKSRGRWNQTQIILLGLSALGGGDATPLNLKSSGVQVSLFIKPARRERDNVIQWAIDRNVSLVDVGATIFRWLDLKSPGSTLGEALPQDLSSALSRPEPAWEEDRLIVTESAWPEWLEGAGVRWSVRQNQFLYIHDQKPLIYNTLTDRNETLALKTNDPLWLSLNTDVIGLVRRAKMGPFAGMAPRWPEALERARSLWAEPRPAPTPEKKPTRWDLRAALERRDWREVRRLALALGDANGVFIAGRQLGESTSAPKDPCLRLVLGEKSGLSECGDEKILALAGWRAARGETGDRFNRLMTPYLMDQDIGRQNYLNGLRWDVDRDLPEGPQLVDYALTLKEFKALAR